MQDSRAPIGAQADRTQMQISRNMQIPQERPTETVSITPDLSNAQKREGNKIRHLLRDEKEEAGWERARLRKVWNLWRDMIPPLAHHLSRRYEPAVASVTLINRAARNTNQSGKGVINPLCSKSVLQKVKLKLIRITLCWLIVAHSRAEEGGVMACVQVINDRWSRMVLTSDFHTELNLTNNLCLYF